MNDYLVDTHAHLFSLQLPLDNVIQNARDHHVNKIINVGLNIETSLLAFESAERYPDMIIPTIGIHPSEAKDLKNIDQLPTLISKHGFTVIGEIGLDYYRLYSLPDVQISLFLKQLDLASQLSLPVIIHNRQADEDIIRYLSPYKHLKKVFHCYSSTIEFANQFRSENTYFSFTGAITYAKKGKVIQTIQELNLSEIMIESDCPYLTPEHYKGQENQPAYVTEICKKIAQIKNVSYQEVQDKTTENANQFLHV